MIIQIHTLKQHAPSNLNRDDSGAPKSCIFAGTERLRISSQCLKRKIRTGNAMDSFRANAGASDMIRTRSLKEYVLSEVSSDPVIAVATAVAIHSMAMAPGNFEKSLGKADKKKDIEPMLDPKSKTKISLKGGVADISMLDESDMNVFVERSMLEGNYDGTQVIALSKNEIKTLAGMIEDARTEDSSPGWVGRAVTEYASAIKLRNNRGDLSSDVAMFGRMITGEGLFDNVDSAIQVAHAISTRPMNLDVDFWTAADDFITDNGSAHMGDRMFAASTFYEYASINVDTLKANLLASGFDNVDEIAADMIKAVIASSVMENPSGYQNSFASHPLASSLVIHVGSGSPFSAASAFADFDEDKPELQDAESRLDEWKDNTIEQYGDLLFGSFIEGDTINEIVSNTIAAIKS